MTKAGEREVVKAEHVGGGPLGVVEEPAGHRFAEFQIGQLQTEGIQRVIHVSELGFFIDGHGPLALVHDDVEAPLLTFFIIDTFEGDVRRAGVLFDNQGLHRLVEMLVQKVAKNAGKLVVTFEIIG